MPTSVVPSNRFRCAVLPLLAFLAGAGSGALGDPPRSHLEPARVRLPPNLSTNALGLKLTRASAVLRRQLALARGAGLVVEDVAADSAAARAGFSQHDVLVKLHDQLLVLPEQLDALLEASEGGDPLECIVLRNGREITISLAGEPRRETRPVAASVGLRPAASALAIVAPPSAKRGAETRQPASETLLREDADYHIRLTSGTETRLVVTNRVGHVLFDDSIDTPAGRQRVPADVRARVADMERQLERPVEHPAEAAAGRPVPRPRADVGRLGIAPVELR